jgi:transcriptional regulator with XRE-family HTH domain
VRRRRLPQPTELRRPSGKPLEGRAVLATNLRRLRRERGLSQEALAERAGIHRTYLGSVERAERNVAIDNICRIAWALGVRPADLLHPA